MEWRWRRTIVVSKSRRESYRMEVDEDESRDTELMTKDIIDIIENKSIKLKNKLETFS